MSRPNSLSLALIAGTALAGIAATASAQEADPVDAIIACRNIADPQERLDCFDATSGSLAQARATGELVTVSRADVAAVERDGFGFDLPSMPRISMSLFGNREPNALAVAEVAEPASPQPGASQPQPGSPAAVQQTTPPPAPAPVAEPDTNDGVTVMRRDDEGGIEEISMVIERVREYDRNKHRFYMTNGQVWRQIDTERIRINRNGENNAVIRRAAMGSYLMQINDRGTAIRVERER